MMNSQANADNSLVDRKDDSMIDSKVINQRSGADQVPRDVALNVALAARALPDTEIKDLLHGIFFLVGAPLSTVKLAKLDIGNLKRLNFLQETEDSDLENALNFLRGQGQKEVANKEQEQGQKLKKNEGSLQFLDTGTASDSLPTIQASITGQHQELATDQQGYIQVACASNSGDLIDGHFGSCSRFLIYQISAQELRLVDIRIPAKALSGDEKNIRRAQLINDCQVLYTVSIGGPAAAKVVRAGLHPIKLPGGGAAPQILDRLRETIAVAPPPWLAKAMGVAPEQRVRFREDIQP